MIRGHRGVGISKTWGRDFKTGGRGIGTRL